VQRFYLGLTSVTLVVLGVYLSLGAYHFPQLTLNYYQTAGSVLVWSGAFLLVVSYLIRGEVRTALHFARTPKGAVVGGVYFAFHLLLYGFVLEGILVYLYGSAPFVTSPFVFISSNLLYPASLANALVGIAFSPNLTILIPPIYDASLSLFSIITAIIIDILIMANVGAVGKIGSVKSTAIRARAYLAMPVAGIALGASCCMSLPVLLSIADPALTILSSLIWVFYLTYFVLPVLAAVVLKLNFDLANRTASAAERLLPPLSS
jgi:hypothetical protein